MSYLRNPLAWYKRYVEEIYDTPSSPSSIVGRAGHIALQHYYGGIDKAGAEALGLQYLQSVPDFEINFGVAKTRKAQKAKRLSMQKEYVQAISFYLDRPPKYKVVGVEVKGTVTVKGLPLPLKAVSDLVVESKVEKGALDIVDHKFVESFTKLGASKALFIVQAIFNYYTVTARYKQPVRRFIVYECKKSRNADGSSQMRKYVIDFSKCGEEFKLFHRLIKDTTADLKRKRVFLPNPSDMFEGENSFDIYRLGLIDEDIPEKDFIDR
ncbi:MAG: hypothetical protein JWO43_45 [Candidatus Adlerbacteria bacterium]|nr:hypothetical protein [Candidatus Adlerbacteria bacterium]